MAPPKFEKYLYKEHSAVYLSPTKTDLRLLDVLIKTDSEGLLPRRPVIHKVGSMLNLGRQGEEFDSTLGKLKEGLESFERTGEGGDLFKWSDTEQFQDTISSGASITGTLLCGLVNADLQVLNRSKTVTCTIGDLKIAGVDKTTLVDIMVGENDDDPPRWKPNVDKRAFRWPQPGRRIMPGASLGHKLWIVYEILYAEDLIVESDDSTSAGGGVGADTIVQCILPGPGGSLRVSVTGAASLEVHAATPGEKFAFAFRTLCFQFDAAGEGIVKVELDAGKSSHVPIFRSRDDKLGVYDDPREQLGGLFLSPPSKLDADSETEEFLRLEIQTSPDADIEPV